MKTSIVAVLTLLLAATIASASPRADQPPYVQTIFELVLNDGSRAYGRIEQETDTQITFRTTSGAVLTTSKARIVTLRPVLFRRVGGELRREDPNNTRLLFAPTARSVPRGQTYLGVYEALVPFVQVGVTDRFSIGGGTPLIFAGDFERPYWVTPKLQIYSSENTHAAVGLFHGVADGESGGVAYAVLTKERPGGAFTVGAGMGYRSDGSRGGVVMVGAEAPATRNIRWITENYVWRSAVITSGGVRFFGERLAADLAIGIAFVDDETIAFPLVNFVYRF